MSRTFVISGQCSKTAGFSLVVDGQPSAKALRHISNLILMQADFLEDDEPPAVPCINLPLDDLLQPPTNENKEQ